jgi:UDP:flavonoid glycosyltransferase YjiC (YdhE family)
VSAFLANCLFPEVPSWFPGQRLYNVASHLLGGEYFWQHMRSAVNGARREVLDLPAFPLLGPPPSFINGIPALFGFSTAVVPKPPDWGEHHHVTGYWFLDHAPDWQPPPDLVDFLESGPAPVCVGFGSMRHPAAEEATDLVLLALERTGQRGVLLTGWGGLTRVRSSERVFAVESVPHDWLFPRVAAVVHHGGAGTTAAACRAGIPSVIIPFMADQPFWGRRLHDLGVAPAPIPLDQLSAERLADALDVVLTDADLAARATALGERIRSEDSVGRAVEILQEHFVGRPQARAGRPFSSVGRQERVGQPAR